jgi:hypothetical protein
MRNKHAITKEFFCMGALKGIIGYSGEQINLFNEFGITPKIINFEFSNSSLNVRSVCMDIVRHLEDNLLGEVMSEVHCWCYSDFFDNLVSHPNVEKAYLNHREAIEKIAGDVRNGFRFGNITFSEYRATASDGDGNQQQFIENGKGYVFPTGTMNTFEIYYSPPVLNGIHLSNTKGQELYAFQTNDPKGRWTDIDTESNFLPICKRPGLLVELTMS